MKCDQYWPARGTETYGLIQVTLLDTVELATYTVRTFALHKVWSCPGACPPGRDLLGQWSEYGVLAGRGRVGARCWRCERIMTAGAVGGMDGSST